MDILIVILFTLSGAIVLLNLILTYSPLATMGKWRGFEVNKIVIHFPAVLFQVWFWADRLVFV